MYGITDRVQFDRRWKNSTGLRGQLAVKREGMFVRGHYLKKAPKNSLPVVMDSVE